MSSEYSSTELSIFQFEDCPLSAYVDAQGLRWVAAGSLCKILGIENVSDAVKRLDDDEVDLIYIIDRLGRSQPTIMVNEYGALTFVLSSRKPKARLLRRWLTHEVLPTLLRTGTYTMPAHGDVAPSPHLPPPRSPVHERAHVSAYLLAVWVTLRQAEDPLSNAQISAKTAMKVATVRKWTRYLLHLGVVDMYETHPEHLFEIPPQADKRHAGYFQRLERLAAMLEQRQRRLFT
jgi:hypothetical protein